MASGAPSGASDLSPAQDAAENARYWIEQAGGLASASDLAKRWDVTRTRVVALTRKPTFPAPVGFVNARPVYSFAECDAWREQRKGAAGPPDNYKEAEHGASSQ